jgi:hypothetical protein
VGLLALLTFSMLMRNHPKRDPFCKNLYPKHLPIDFILECLEVDSLPISELETQLWLDADHMTVKIISLLNVKISTLKERVQFFWRARVLVVMMYIFEPKEGSLTLDFIFLKSLL